MTDLHVAFDQFTEGSPAYGPTPAMYSRCKPWNTDSASGYSIPCAVGTLHAGYFSAFSGSPKRADQIPRPASFTSSSGTSAVLCGALYRPYSGTRQHAILAFQSRLLSGTWNDSFRYAAVTVRNSAGTLDNTSGSEHIHTSDGYWFGLFSDAAAGGARYQVLRVNAGVTTLLAQTAAFTLSRDQAIAPRSLGLIVDDSGATVVLTPQVEFFENLATINGLVPVNPFGANVVDSSGSRITASGRVGFAMSKERLQSSPTIATATLAHYFAARDLGLNAYIVWDDFERAVLEGSVLVTGELHGANGRSLMSAWGGDHHSLQGSKLLRDSGNNRVAVTSDAEILSLYSQRPASQRTYSRRKVLVNFETGGTSRYVGVMVRCTNIEDPVAIAGYRLTLRCVSGASFNLVLEDPSTGLALATKNGISLSVATNITLELEVTNVDGVNAESGFPLLTPYIDGSTVSSWTSVSSSVEQIGNTFKDRRDTRVLSGVQEGLYVVTFSPAHDVYIDTWNETQPAGADLGESAHASIDLGGEQDGKTGTLTVPLEFPEVRRVLPVAQHVFESRRRQRIRLASRERRFYRGGMRAAKRIGEADAFRAFIESHKGSATPFDFVAPDGSTVVVAFKVAKQGTTHAAPEVVSYDTELEERIA